MPETKMEQRQRIIKHKHKKEELRRQMGTFNALIKEPKPNPEHQDRFIIYQERGIAPGRVIKWGLNDE